MKTSIYWLLIITCILMGVCTFAYVVAKMSAFGLDTYLWYNGVVSGWVQIIFWAFMSSTIPFFAAIILWIERKF